MKHLIKLEIPTKEDMKVTRILLGLSMDKVTAGCNVPKCTIHRIETGKPVLYTAWIELINYYNTLIDGN